MKISRGNGSDNRFDPMMVEIEDWYHPERDKLPSRGDEARSRHGRFIPVDTVKWAMANLTKSAGGERFSTAVVEAVAERVGTDPVNLDPPLYRAIDPDALDELLASLGTNGKEGSVSFSYLDFEITVRSDGTVHLDDATDPALDSNPN